MNANTPTCTRELTNVKYRYKLNDTVCVNSQKCSALTRSHWTTRLGATSYAARASTISILL